MNKTKIKPSEAVYGVLGWLTTLVEPLTLGRHHDAAPAAEAAKAFCKKHGLEDPRPDWQGLEHPDWPQPPQEESR